MSHAPRLMHLTGYNMQLATSYGVRGPLRMTADAAEEKEHKVRLTAFWVPVTGLAVGDGPSR
jgi:hypothetical protein